MVKRFIKKYFVPHKGNEYRPHLFRLPAVIVLLAVLIGGAFLASRAIRNLQGNGSYAAVYSGTVIAYTNQNREGSGDGDLTESPLLTQAAQMKANDMAANGYFAHTSPDGKTSWYWFDQVGYKYEYAGENLAINYDDSQEVTNAWMASPTHRANILYPSFTQIGVATAVGMYQGRETTFVVQMFGTPKEAVKPVAAPASIPQKEIAAATTSAIAMATSAPEKRVEGAYAADTSIVNSVVASPSKSVAYIYYAFIIVIAGILIFGAAYEWKRHHRSMWISAGVLILAAAIIALLIVHHGQGLIDVSQPSA